MTASLRMMAALRPISTMERDRIRDAQPTGLSGCGKARSRTASRSAAISPPSKIDAAIRACCTSSCGSAAIESLVAELLAASRAEKSGRTLRSSLLTLQRSPLSRAFAFVSVEARHSLPTTTSKASRCTYRAWRRIPPRVSSCRSSRFAPYKPPKARSCGPPSSSTPSKCRRPASLRRSN